MSPNIGGMPLEEGTPGEYAVWFLVLVGAWAIASPFVYADSVSGAAYNNYIGIGLVTALVAAFVARRIRE